ncbi:MAG: recombination mediator protein UvsY [Candidatus Thiodiazotropha taylori]|uniref:Recombination mediator protein UvsY n=1 Tax=Candidatus Thiodiazotropha taylori TaxID=2792791 RepID=A0A9E4N249_9GAMM|nr:recombination mediator protein UvsY [Candidatus Thiodiazotropha taylori]MCW4255066.1 recombination mediator protein UvsY [Candidatus Thiodiazotropha taylori]
MTHDELLALWDKDTEIDKTSLDDESLAIPKLHHKYLTIYLKIKANKIAYEHKLEILRKDKELYYSGQATSDIYKDKPFDIRLKTKAGVQKHVDTDPEVVVLLQKLEYMNVLLEGLNHILQQIQWRNQHIKSAIDWIKFQSGGI